ncbi:16S rRNA m(2)G 1207 methyltransferase /23S rRNA m(2)G-1835 methyltransferase [Plantibacter flavus]|uniref:16S rRNA m(2)G 1207 methyltransferase /23S rRNA m(2)G-1835 methyltransferase n=1 Tax=Plantibacter flavus TaxID=150123 RepID=A0A3N2BZ91_9MICO|nr:methyltransferase [Plantibacter flavus]ROR80557.1 16S rRNA m(2)G 1207 methyltransferase /23S rRNA m(2)G-1835 methyltransferase [Plantibacter flavus]SMG33296.1 16S rRNA m(2)G 1207 methyltransferase /23S rRNA m(2)G-1835 methyltransferase [Plantibacter flavus]
MPEFSFDALRRFPDHEAPNLFAVDATDRFLLDEAAVALAGRVPTPGEIVVVGDAYGALTLGAVALLGATDVRVHQDAAVGERALAANAERLGVDGGFRNLPLGDELFTGASLVLLQLPKHLEALHEIAAAVARWGAADVRLLAGGRVKHLTPAMNEVLGRSFSTVTASLARQKSRVLRASDPVTAAVEGERDETDTTASTALRTEHHADIGLTIAAAGAAFAGTKLDIGTRFLLEALPDIAPDARTAIDLGCGTGVLAVSLAIARPELAVIATDQSAAAVASTTATIAANDDVDRRLAERITVLRDDGLSMQPDASADLIVLNPPFHSGTTVHTGVAHDLFAEAARVLQPGGTLAVVWNSHLGYRAALERLVGPTRQFARNQKFTVTVSRPRAVGEPRP